MVSTLGKAVLAVTDQSLTRSIFTKTRPGRALSTRFVAGETLDDAAAVAAQLNEQGARVSLDHLGEHVSDVHQALLARDDYLEALRRIQADGLDANISVKLTQLGLGLDDDLALESLDLLAQHANELGLSVTVDMEESQHTEGTISIYEKAQLRRGNVGIAVQAYLRRTRDDLDRIIPAGGHVRLCKGAYAEPESVAYQDKDDVDASFDRLAAILMASENIRPAIASHDEARLTFARRLATQRSGYHEYQMLYGVRVPLQRAMIADGLQVRVYVPYGTDWYPYLTRRIAERPANLWFFLRAAVSRG